jgi:predicted DNA-binding transcriptional regulator
MGVRRIRRMQRQFDMAKSRRENGMIKVKERVRRDLRMTETVKKGSLPYIPAVMSWLSVKLDKPSSEITADDVAKFLAQSTQP